MYYKFLIIVVVFPVNGEKKKKWMNKWKMLSYFNRISVFVWTGENGILMRHVCTRISSITEGKISVFKNIWMCVDKA